MTGKIDHIGMWTWGGRVYNWKRYLDNMQAVGMDTVVLWHTDKAPHNAADIQAYAGQLGISVIWGFNWSWNSPICLNSEEDADHWREIVTDLIRTSYAPLEPDGICFQVGGTELANHCRLDCEVCKETYKTGAGPLFIKFAGRIMDAIQAEWPSIKLFANLHLGAVHQSYKALSVLDPSINIMWEDLPGPGWHIEVPFAYDWSPEHVNLTDNTIDMVRRMCELRGDQEDVAFIIKGFPAHCLGEDPTLLEEFDLQALAAVYEWKWNAAARYCEDKLEQALRVFRVIAESPAKTKTALLLVEHGLWEYRRYFAAVLIAEALRNPFREPEDVIAAVRFPDAPRHE